jgi:hypothetical protein
MGAVIISSIKRPRELAPLALGELPQRRRLAIGHIHQVHPMPLPGQADNAPPHPQFLIIRMRADDEY